MQTKNKCVAQAQMKNLKIKLVSNMGLIEVTILCLHQKYIFSPIAFSAGSKIKAPPRDLFSASKPTPKTTYKTMKPNGWASYFCKSFSGPGSDHKNSLHVGPQNTNISLIHHKIVYEICLSFSIFDVRIDSLSRQTK